MNENIFKYTTKSRPATYRNIEFRSELEAAWAAFFDLRGVKYEYEPLLDLKSWRPDFSIMVPDIRSLSDPADDSFFLVEVKPYFTQEQWKKDTTTLSKISDSFDSPFRVLLLGTSPAIREANAIWGIDAGPEESENIEFLLFGDRENLSQDWNRAKTTVKWRP